VGIKYFSSMYGMYNAQRAAGEFISNKENVLIIGSYFPKIISHKVLIEKQKSNSSPDFGWILLSHKRNHSVLTDYIKDYHTDKYEINTGSFDGMFDESDFPGAYRKNSNISDPDYVVVCGFHKFTTEGTIVFNYSGLHIFKKTG
jgi:hypothetical protein